MSDGRKEEDDNTVKRKIFCIAGILMFVFGAGYLVFAMHNPEMSFRWSNDVTYLLYGIYAAAALLLTLMPLIKKNTAVYITALIISLSAIVLLVMSVFKMGYEREQTWFLPAALLLNVISLGMSTWNSRKEQKKKEKEDDRNESDRI